MNEIKVNKPATSRLINGKIYNLTLKNTPSIEYPDYDYKTNSKDSKNLEYIEKGLGDKNIYVFISHETGEVVEIPKNKLISAQEVSNKLGEIKINKPKVSITLSEEAQNIIKDRVISYIKEIIQEDGHTFLYYLLDEVYISDGDSNYDIVASFIIEQMIANDYELYHNGEEILLTNSNSNLVTREDIENYLEENTKLKKYLEKLTWEYYFNEIDINDLYYNCIRAVKKDMERGNWGEGEYDKRDFESIVDKELDNHDLWPDSILTYNPEFQDYLQIQFLRADKLNEMKNTQLLREYPESTISKILTKWGVDPDPKSQDSKVKAARALITRFEQIKGSIPQKLDILVIPDDIKKKDPRNIELYSLEDMIKLIKSYPENPDKIKKDAIENFVTKYQIDKPTAQSYVARFMTKKDNLKYAIENGTEDGNFTKEEVLELIPKRLLQNNLYLDPRNWQWQSFEQMLDALFPSQKQATGEEGSNEATTDADKIYDKDGIEIYQGDDVHKCISYNPVNPGTKRKKYGWCVTQIGNTNYDYYRFGDKSPTFYFVFDRSKTSEPEHAPFNDQWHAFVVQVNNDGESYVVTGADNRGDMRAESWESISKIVSADTWNKIKNLKQYFKPIPLSAIERGRKFASGRNLSLDEFKELSQDEKILYIQGKASKNALPNTILTILPQYKINLEGRSTTLANVAIDSGQTFPYSILKDNEALAKRYAIFRFRHTNYGSTPIPLPYIKYLDEEGQKKYYKEFGKGGNEDSFLTFELIEKYFGEAVTKQYVNSQLKHLGFLPPEAINYIDNPKLKTLFKAVSKLYEPWKYGKYTNVSDEELANATSQPPQDVTPLPIDVKQWAKLTPEERKIIIELTEKYNGNSDYVELMYASPFIIKDKGQTLILLPEPSSEGDYQKWVLVNDQDKVIKRNISGDSTLDGDEINSGYNNAVSEDFKRVYDIKDLDIIESDSKSLDEIKVNRPSSNYKLKFPDIKTVDMDNDDEIFNIIETIAKLNPKIPQQYFEAGSVYDDVTDWEGNRVNGPVVPFKVFLESYFYWLGRNLVYDLNSDNENIYDIDYDNNEVKRFAKAAADGTWLMIPGISDFKNLNYIKEIKDGNDLWELIKPEFEKIILGDLDEIKVNKPGSRTWDFTKYIPNFNPNKIKEGDIFILPNNNDTTPYRLKIERIINKTYWFVDGEFVVKLSNLINWNKENKKSLNEIKINKPGRNLQVIVDNNFEGENFPHFFFPLDITLAGKRYNSNIELSEYFVPSKDYVSIVYELDNKAYEIIMEYLKEKRIPFKIYNENNNSIIDGNDFNYPATPHGMAGLNIIVNKRYFIVPKEYQEEFNKHDELDEIKVNKPGSKTWDFTKYIPGLVVKKIKAGDIIIMPSTNPVTPHGKLKVKSINDWDDTISFDDGGFLYLYDLVKKNIQNKPDLDEIKVNKPGDLSIPINLERILNKIPNEKYFQKLEDYEGEERWDDDELMDILYEPFFDEYLKGKPGIEEDNYWDWRDEEREKSDSDYGPLDSLVLDKLWSIVGDYRNQQEDLDEIKVNKPGILTLTPGEKYWVLNSWAKWELLEFIDEYSNRLSFKTDSGNMSVGKIALKQHKIRPENNPPKVNEIKINKPGRGKLEVKVNDRPDINRVFYSFEIDNGDFFSLHSSYFSNDYVSVYLSEDDIYADLLHEDIINYLNKNKIPFAISNEDNDSIIDGDKFEIPEDPEDMFNRDILINKKDCKVPKEYQENFYKL